MRNSVEKIRHKISLRSTAITETTDQYYRICVAYDDGLADTLADLCHCCSHKQREDFS